MIIGICIGIIVAIFCGDLWIKNHIERTASEGSIREWMGGFLLIRKHHNRGMPMNFGQKKRVVVTVLSVVAVVVVLVIFILSLGRHGNNMLRIGLSMILGGGFSNTYDRLKRKYVVDYVSFGVKWKGLRKIIFNCSDFCIIIGALLLVLGAGQ